jgi:hypothetical protein
MNTPWRGEKTPPFYINIYRVTGSNINKGREVLVKRKPYLINILLGISGILAMITFKLKNLVCENGLIFQIDFSGITILVALLAYKFHGSQRLMPHILAFLILIFALVILIISQIIQRLRVPFNRFTPILLDLVRWNNPSYYSVQNVPSDIMGTKIGKSNAQFWF